MHRNRIRATSTSINRRLYGHYYEGVYVADRLFKQTEPGPPNVSLAEVRENKRRARALVVTRFGLSINVRRETCNSSPSVFRVTRVNYMRESDYGADVLKPWIALSQRRTDERWIKKHSSIIENNRDVNKHLIRQEYNKCIIFKKIFCEYFVFLWNTKLIYISQMLNAYYLLTINI